MNLPAAVSLVSAVLAVAAGLVALRVSRAPGSWDQRPFAAVGLSAAAYALCSLPSALGAPDAVVLRAAGWKASAVTLHLWAWLRFSRAFLGRGPPGAERALSAALLACAALPLVPGLVLGDAVAVRPYPSLGFVYRHAAPTAAGGVLVAGLVVASLVPLARFARAWRAGAPHAGVVAASGAAVIAFGASDALSSVGLGLGLPYLLPAAFAAPPVAVTWVITARFVEGARALERLRAELLRDVEDRTRELSSALEALHQSERLAALGRFAGGVAHEVNSPAAVVSANLRYLQESLRGGALPADAEEAVADALASMQRITGLVRKLADAGRIASAGGDAARASVAELARGAAAEARRRLAASGTAVHDEVPEGLVVRAPREVLEQVLGTLLANAADSIPAGHPGRITLRAEGAAGVVRIAVTDDGAGMAPDVLRRAFEPFFTTKRVDGRGAGLGLAVARALVEGHGGALWLESRPGAGTTARLELPAAPPDEAPRRTPAPGA